MAPKYRQRKMTDYYGKKRARMKRFVKPKHWDSKFRRKVRTNKQLTRSVRQLWSMNKIKAHYVEDTATTAVATPTIMELTGIGAGEGKNQHEGNSIKLRSLQVHGQTRVTNTGGVPSISHPTRWNVMIVSSTLDVGLAGVPSYTRLFDDTNLPATMALFDSFRMLNNEDLSKVKILYKKSFTLAAQTNDGISGAVSSTYPGYRFWTINLSLSPTVIEYREGTSTAINRQLYIMLTTNSTGAAGNLGLEHAFVSKLSFRDME